MHECVCVGGGGGSVLVVLAALSSLENLGLVARKLVFGGL